MNSKILNPAFCAANKIITTGTEGKSKYFGLVDINDSVLKSRIKKTFPEYQCVFSKMDQEIFNLKLSQLFSEETADVTIPRDSQYPEENQIDRITDDAPAINLLNSIFLEALSKRASDIHIETGPADSSVRYRIDGLLETAKTITAGQAAAVSARLKVLANLNVLENRRPQDGHLDIRTNEYSLDVRISIVPGIWGESLVLRLLNRSNVPLDLDVLGFTGSNMGHIKNLLTISSGLVLVTGPTGSGKTTTLAAILDELKIRKSKIISIEDPVEYRINGITQIQVNEELELTFDSILRRIFRQDPDIIMIGEIRDIQTAELAVRAALTGHLVFATLHTNNAAEAIYRMQDMGIPAYMTAAVLKMIITQRLIRKICKQCGNKGCVQCSGTGFYGRTVIAEIISVNEEIREIISANSKNQTLQSYLLNNNHKTLWDDAMEKIAGGITAMQEIQRELGNFSEKHN